MSLTPTEEPENAEAVHETEPQPVSHVTAKQRAQNKNVATLVVGVFFFMLIATFAITIFIHYAGLHHSVLAPQ